MITLFTVLLAAAPVEATKPAVMPITPPICAERCINPIEAVTLTAQIGNGAGVMGDFAMTVKAVGFDRGRFYLNSEPDYRDRNCLTVVVPAAVMTKLAGSADLEAVKKLYVGNKINTRGVARQVRVDFIVENQPTGKYYYQSHLFVANEQNLVRTAS